MEQKAGQEQSRLVDGYVIVIRQVIPIKIILLDLRIDRETKIAGIVFKAYSQFF
ncbi:MAG: hypothetical protein AAF063_00725 [Cyanobacteria bacterium J06643_5]